MRKLKFFFRRFRKNIRLNMLNLSSVAIGVAAAIILLGYVYQELHYDSQYTNSGRIYRILTQNEKGELWGASSYALLAQELKSEFPEVEDATRLSFYWGNLALTAGDKMFNENNILFSDPNFFSLFLFPIKEGDTTNGLDSPDFIAISESAAKKYFGDRNSIGQQIKIGADKIFTVRLVFKDFPPNSNFQGDIILPLKRISELTQMWIEPSWKFPSETYTFILTEKKSNEKELSRKIENYLFKHVKENPGKLFLQPLKEIHTDLHSGWEFSSAVNKKYLFLLTIVAVIVLAMSAINFLMLYIGTASLKQLNVGVKKVCGASRFNVFTDQYKESLLFVSMGVLSSFMIVILYNFIIAPRFSHLPFINNIDAMLFFVLVSTVLLFVLLSTLLPALIISATKSFSFFRTRQYISFKKIPIVKSLVITQFVISIVLIATTTLFYKQVHFLERYDPGFAGEELVTIPLNMHIGEGFYNENMGVFCDELRKQSGVKNVTLAFSSPSDIQTSSDKIRCDGMPEGKTINIQWNSVFYDYFKTIGVSLIDGRSFSPEFTGDMVDFDNGGKCVYVINQKAANEMGISDPIGKTLYAHNEGPIIGVVEDFNFKSLHSEITPMCFNMNPFYYNQIIIRINSGNSSVLEQIKTVWRQFVPDYPIEFSFVSDQINKMYESERKLTVNLNIFSGIAIMIACIGLLSLSLLAIQNRIKEIGIRKVNGAKVSEILAMLNKDFIRWVFIAFVFASPLAFFIMYKWLDNFAYKTNLSWWIFALAGLLSFGIALLTVSWQSWRAATRNPVESLRYE